MPSVWGMYRVHDLRRRVAEERIYPYGKKVPRGSIFTGRGDNDFRTRRAQWSPEPGPHSQVSQRALSPRGTVLSPSPSHCLYCKRRARVGTPLSALAF